jgi:pimeloyl-ACP methyl ester carboxylesterase
LGYRVILSEYPAYGGRKGTLGEKAFVADGVETVRLAFEQFGGPVFLLGESLGCGVAASVAAQMPVKIAGIILITPWDTLLSVAQSKFSFLPVRPLLTDKYDSIDNLKSFKGRIALVGAERDEIIPIKHAKRLYDSLSAAEKRMWIVKGAGHNDWPMYEQASLWNEITTFMEGK